MEEQRVREFLKRLRNRVQVTGIIADFIRVELKAHPDLVSFANNVGDLEFTLEIMADIADKQKINVGDWLKDKPREMEEVMRLLEEIESIVRRTGRGFISEHII